MLFLSEVTHRGVTAVHYQEDRKYMLWYYKKGDPRTTIGFVQVRGLTRPLTDSEIKTHIDKLWERYYLEKERKVDKDDKNTFYTDEESVPPLDF